MRVANGLISGALLGLCGWLLAQASHATGGVTWGLASLGALSGLLTALRMAPDPERQDRLAYGATLGVSFALMLWVTGRGIAPLLATALGGLGAGPASLLTTILAPLIPALVVYRLSVSLLGLDAADLGLVRPPRPPSWPQAVATGAWLVVASAIAIRVGEPPPHTWLGLMVSVAYEEFFYRGFLRRALEERLGHRAGIVGQALVFALAGGLGPTLSLPRLLVRFGVGILAGLVMARSGSLGPAWVARVLGSVLGG